MLLKADRETARHFLPGVSRSVLQQKVIKALQEEPVVRANEDWSPGLISAYPFKDSLLCSVEHPVIKSASHSVNSFCKSTQVPAYINTYVVQAG